MCKAVLLLPGATKEPPTRLKVNCSVQVMERPSSPMQELRNNATSQSLKNVSTAEFEISVVQSTRCCITNICGSILVFLANQYLVQLFLFGHKLRLQTKFLVLLLWVSQPHLLATFSPSTMPRPLGHVGGSPQLLVPQDYISIVDHKTTTSQFHQFLHNKLTNEIRLIPHSDNVPILVGPFAKLLFVHNCAQGNI